MATIGIIDATVGVETFRAQDGGCLGYLVVDEASHTAWAIDPRLDQVEELLDAVNARGLRLTHVLDTHTHAEPPVTYGEGEMWYEAPGAIHSISRNASGTEPAKLIAFFVADQKQVLTEPISN